MVETVEIPLSWANTIPGVSGVRDVEFDVPQLDEIVDDVADAVPDLDSIEDAVDRNVPDIDEIVEDVVEGVEDAIDDIDIPGIDEDQLIDDVIAGIEDALPDLTLDVEEIADDIGDEIDDVIPAQALNVGEIADGVADRLEDDLQVGGADPQDIADEILAGQDDFDIPAPEVSIDGVFGPLTSDVVQAFNSILDERVQAPGVDIPSVDDVRTAVQEGVEEVLEGLPASGLLFDPDQFVDDQIDRLAGRILSEDDQQQLEDLAERVQP